MCLDAVVFTVMLQNEGLPDTSSMTVNKLDFPALNGSIAARRRDEPSRGGGVNVGVAVERADQDADAASALSGKLKATRFDARETTRRSDRRAHAAATQTFCNRPVFICDGFRMKQEQSIQRHPQRRDCRRIKFSSRIAPHD